ncbi:hypothetical protein Q3V22_09430, partial [Acinetobacter baumannii]|nr:hypothetical protein [Acinetobacter baumannii]
PINESAIIGRPVGCTISFRSRFIHFEIIGLNKPYRLGLCNKAAGKFKFSKKRIFGCVFLYLHQIDIKTSLACHLFSLLVVRI